MKNNEKSPIFNKIIEDKLRELNHQQREAATTTARDVLVLAGAGTGKTRTIDARAIQLIHSGTKASRVALLSFTKMAADEMKARLREPFHWIRVGIFCGTFHKLCLSIMRDMPEEFGYRSLKIWDGDDQRIVMNDVIKEVKKETSLFKLGTVIDESENELLKARKLIELFSYLRNVGEDLEDHLSKHNLDLDIDADDISKILIIHEKYKEAKDQSRAMDFDDILFHFESHLGNSKDLRAKIKNKYDHILVDEMQDTNPIQWSILEHLRDPAHLFCVGDDAQSIYAFRGADFHNVHSFRNRIPGAEIIKLVENYRSKQKILDLSNWLLSESHLPYNKKLKAIRGEGELPLLLDFPNEQSEASWIVNDLKTRKADNLTWSDISILSRTKHACNHVQAQLKLQSVPYIFIGGISLFQRSHIKDLLSPMGIILNHKDRLAWIRFLELWPNIGKKTAIRFYKEVKIAKSWEDVVKLLKTFMSHYPEMAEGLAAMKEREHQVRNVVYYAIDMLKKVPDTKALKSAEMIQDWKIIQEMAQHEPDLQHFIAMCAVDDNYGSKENSSEDDHLRLMTVHSAKGTEAKICYLLQVNDDKYPHPKSTDIEEERRVLYVAMTRAMDSLVITRSGFSSQIDHFAGGGHKTYGNYLLNRLPSELVRYKYIQEGNSS